MSNLIKHAKVELKLAGMFDSDSDYDGELGKAVLELVEVFAKQGHSGFSAISVVNLFNQVARYQPLLPLTGKDDEWNQPTEGGTKNIFQNKRCSAVFKDGKDGIPHYLEAIIWQGEETHDSFTGSVEGIQSRQNLKFPFRPKTFHIDVVKKNGDYFVKDKKQLDKVFKHYIKTVD